MKGTGGKPLDAQHRVIRERGGPLMEGSAAYAAIGVLGVRFRKSASPGHVSPCRPAFRALLRGGDASGSVGLAYACRPDRFLGGNGVAVLAGLYIRRL